MTENFLKKIFEKFVLFLHKKYGITPNFLTYIRIFMAPWLAFLVLKTIDDKNIKFLIFTLVFYALVIITDFLDGLLARHIPRDHDHIHGGMLDRLSDKLLIIFMLIPFGFNLLTSTIIVGESVLAYQAINSPGHKKCATRAGKLKMFFQALLIPLLILSRTTNLIPDIFLFIFLVMTIFLTFNSIYSHYSQNEKVSR